MTNQEELKKAIKGLKEYNIWRRWDREDGAEQPEMPFPKDIGVWIDTVVENVNLSNSTHLNWQPIETAPKTSKSIMVYCQERQNIYIVYWGKCNGFLNIDVWKIFGSNSDLSHEEPTHWQPLPESPKENE